MKNEGQNEPEGHGYEPPFSSIENERQLLEAAVVDATHHLHDDAIGHALVAANEDRLVITVLGNGFELRRQVIELRSAFRR